MNKATFLKLAMPFAMASAGSAHATYTTYFGEDQNNSATVPLVTLVNSQSAQASFLSTLTGAGVENFETRSGSGPLALSFTGYSGGTLTGTLSGAGNVVINAAGQTNGFGRYSVPGGTHYWDTNLASSTLQLTFGQKIAAFGFYGVDIGDFGGQAVVDLYVGTTLLKSLSVSNTIGNNGSTDGSVLYFGVIAGTSAETFDTIKFRTTLTGNDTFGFDSFTVAELRQVGSAPPPGGTVPEPTSLALAGLALAAAGFATRLTRRA